MTINSKTAENIRNLGEEMRQKLNFLGGLSGIGLGEKEEKADKEEKDYKDETA